MSTAQVLVFAFVLGFAATLAEPALAALRVTVQRLTKGGLFCVLACVMPLACIAMAHIVMAYIVMACVVMAYMVMAYIVMSNRSFCVCDTTCIEIFVTICVDYGLHSYCRPSYGLYSYGQNV